MNHPTHFNKQTWQYSSKFGVNHLIKKYFDQKVTHTDIVSEIILKSQYFHYWGGKWQTWIGIL